MRTTNKYINTLSQLLLCVNSDHTLPQSGILFLWDSKLLSPVTSFYFFFLDIFRSLKWPSWVQGGNYRQQTEFPWERIPPLETVAVAWTRNCACSAHRRTRSSPLKRWRASVVNTAQLKLTHTSDPGALWVLNTGIRFESFQSFCYGTYRRQVECYFVMNMQESQFNLSRVQLSMGKAKSNFCDWCDNQWHSEGGLHFNPPPLNLEGPPKSYQIQPDCENC